MPADTRFVSYSQNFEDVVLWRALGHIEEGFYIDVGAWSPDLDSVTRAFYERGWTGINIEPNPEFLSSFEQRRPKDTNLQVAISDELGEATLHVLDCSGLSTLDEKIAKHHGSEGILCRPETVRTATLSHIWETHAANRDVHFLKVDVEGLERKVLESNDWLTNRPWLVVVEATFPMSSRETHHEWEDILAGADYGLVYADGLNRFYLAEEHGELGQYFRYPPNVFDNFKPATLEAAEQRARNAEEMLLRLKQNPICRAVRAAGNIIRKIR